MNKLKIKPLGERVLLKRIEEKDQIKGGIIIPDSSRTISQFAEVVAVGTCKKDNNGKQVDFTLKKGDKVILPVYGGTPVKIDDDNFILIDEDSLLGKVE